VALLVEKLVYKGLQMLNFKKKLLILLFSVSLFSSSSFSDEIPIIVIAPGKTIQSESTVGSDVTIISNKELQRSNDFFLGDVLSKSLNGMNYFQSGGHGTNSGIQLRGLPKRYSTVYVDGVKMSDPSSPTNDYYFSNLMKSSIGHVEILKGSQTSLYGSSAIAGTVNLFSKKGREGHHREIELSTGSNATKNFNVSFDGKNNNYDYFVGLNKFLTDGISAMNDNDEKDKYYNDGIVANMGYNITNSLRLENYLRYTDSFLEYDEVTSGRTDGNNTDDQEGSYSLRLIKDEGNLKNTLSYNKMLIQRSTTGYSGKNEVYRGYRDSINLLGEYKVNYDTKVVYGIDNEFDKADFTTWAVTGNQVSDEAVYSQYADLQFRPLEKLYSTIGFRRDNHTTAGAYETGRATLAYKMDKNTKIRSSLGTGIRFASLNDYFYDTNVKYKEDLKPEKSISFDMGIEKFIEKYNLNLELIFFDLEYDDNISNWAGNTDDGKTSGGYVIENSAGKIESRGFEISSKWKPQENLNFSLGYTLTDAHDGEDCDDPATKCIDDMPVRVPRHAINTEINKKFSNNIDTSILVKYASERRDYGNGNNGFADVLLDKYITVDLVGNYNIFNDYNMYFSLTNILDKSYEEAYQYSTPDRAFNFGLRRVY